MKSAYTLTLPSSQMASEFLLPATTERTRWEGRAWTEQTHSLSSFVPIPNWPSSPEPLQKSKEIIIQGERKQERERERERERVTRQWCWKPWEWLMEWIERGQSARLRVEFEFGLRMLFENNRTLSKTYYTVNVIFLIFFLFWYTNFLYFI